MSFSAWDRQIHRWLAILFTLTSLAVGIVIAVLGEATAAWIYYTPLLPLGLLVLSGLYLFVLPYARKRRSRRRLPQAA